MRASPHMLGSSSLATLIKRRAFPGIDVNTANFAAAYAEDATYFIRLSREVRACGEPGRNRFMEQLSVEDLRHAATIDCWAVYRDSGNRDGYVSVDLLSPALADDADATQWEARRLWSLIAKPNAMIKRTGNGCRLGGDSALDRSGNPQRERDFDFRYTPPPPGDGRLCLGIGGSGRRKNCRSITSFRWRVFSVRRIDAAVDHDLDVQIHRPEKAARISHLRGHAGDRCRAICLSRLQERDDRFRCAGGPWRHAMAQPQRLLWTSADSRQACDSDPEVRQSAHRSRIPISSMSLDAAEAYRDHGTAAPTVERNLLEVLAQLGDLETVGIYDLDRVSCTHLERECLGEMTAGVNTALTRLAAAA